MIGRFFCFKFAGYDNVLVDLLLDALFLAWGEMEIHPHGAGQ